MTIVPSPSIPEPSSASPAVPQRLTSLESLVRGYLLRFKPATRRAYQEDIQTWPKLCRRLWGLIRAADVMAAWWASRRTMR